MSSEYAIEVNGLGKCYQIYEKPSDRLKQMLVRGRKQYYKEFWALNNVTFKVKKGETVGIIGRNGSGKSTLLQMICGTLNPTAGEIKVHGRVAALLELGAGFNPEFTGVENVYMAASLYGLGKAEVDQRFDAIAEFADIGDHINQPVKTYSSGMYVRLAFAVIAHVDADVLVIDEALAVGDAFFTQKCMRFLRSFMKSGTVLFVSHDTTSVRSLCNHAIWIDKGEIIESGNPKEVSERYLEAFFESNQGKHVKQNTKPKQVLQKIQKRDPRQDFLNNSNLRNDIRVFEFMPESISFGKREAEIQDVSFIDNHNNTLSWIIGGEEVTIRIRAFIKKDLTSPIIGFHIKDRLGQTLFGDNTYLTYMDCPLATVADEEIVADFKFQMPRLAAGDYSVSAAIADGTQHEHVQHHWIHDALMFRSEATSITSGLLGIPMSNLELKKI
ncbi:MAG: ABC transporter ATP-binding protein [Glaciimonas sp.]|nr:ABC transporter ATP-binding protein [Glaciimonas sp.]